MLEPRPPPSGTSARGGSAEPRRTLPRAWAGDRTGDVSHPVDAGAPVSGGKGLWEKMEMGLSASFINRRLSHTRLGNNPPIVSLA